MLEAGIQRTGLMNHQPRQHREQHQSLESWAQAKDSKKPLGRCRAVS